MLLTDLLRVMVVVLALAVAMLNHVFGSWQLKGYIGIVSLTSDICTLSYHSNGFIQISDRSQQHCCNLFGQEVKDSLR